FPDGAFVDQRKGSASFTLTVHGKAAHVGRDYSQGRSAVFALIRYLQKLDCLRQNADLIINAADLEGKGPVNIVPPFASCRINLRSSDGNLLSQTSSLVHQWAEEKDQEGITLKLLEDSFRPPKNFDINTRCLFKAYAECASELHLPFQTRTTGGVCDGNILAG